MWTVHQRMAELHNINRKRELTEKEMDEMAQCIQANFSRTWEIAKLKNLSLFASMTGDTDWQHELCAKIDKIQG